jgi:hypothetical protein
LIDSVSIQIAVPNGLLFVRDSEVRKFPDFDDEKASFWSIATCVMIACLVDSEGEVDIAVGAADQVVQTQPPAFDRILETPSRKIILEIVPGETVHEVRVLDDKVRIRIWTDGRHRSAESIVIGLG